MKKLYTVLFISLFSIAISGLFSVDTHSNPNGAPAGAAGAPNDPANGCNRSGCHAGSSTLRTGLINSNVPSTGYVPGETYTFTIQITEAGISKWGFQVSPQADNGTLLGTLTLTDANQTRFAAGGGSKYVTHTTAGNSGSIGNKSWTFDWTAPSAGTGDVKFYTYVMASNNNGSTSEDLLFRESVTFQENSGVGFNSLINTTFELFPNPSATGFFIVNGLSTDLNLVKMFDVNGKLVLNELLTFGNNTISTAGFEKGIYFVSVEGKQGRSVKKLIIQ
jgi:hypothetical protein